MYGGMIWRKPETFKSLKILQQICLIIKISGPNSNYMKQNKIKQNKKSTEKKFVVNHNQWPGPNLGQLDQAEKAVCCQM